MQTDAFAHRVLVQQEASVATGKGRAVPCPVSPGVEGLGWMHNWRVALEG